MMALYTSQYQRMTRLEQKEAFSTKYSKLVLGYFCSRKVRVERESFSYLLNRQKIKNN